MKLTIKISVQFYEVNGREVNQIEIPAGIYSVKVKENPSGKNIREWYVFTHPEEIGSEFKNKVIGADKIWVMNQTSISVV